jgi:predicted N-acetyltransferase YhbS
MAVGKDAVTIRDLHLEELSLVRELGKRAFSLPMGLLMAATVSPQGLVAEDATGTIIGALTLRTVSVGNRKVGILDWAVVDPPHQGQGIGKALIHQSLVWLPQQGCDKIITTGVDGYNSASWNAAHAQGLRSWPVSQQIREFGWYWFKLLLVIPHIGVSTFILHLPSNEQERQELPATSGIWTLIGVMLFLGFFLLPLSRVREVLWESTSLSALLAQLNPTTILWGVIITTIYTSVRAIGHWLAARALRLPLAFRLWDSGLMMATLLAVAFSPFIPAFGGGFYVRQSRFNYSQARPAMGKIMLAGVAPSLILLTIFTLWAKSDFAAPGIVATLGCYIGVSFGLTDALLFFAPFQSLPAGHLWQWRRIVWLVVFVWFLAIGFVLARTL